MSNHVSQVNSSFMDLFGFSISPILANFKKKEPQIFNEQLNLIEDGKTFLMRLMSPSTRVSSFNISTQDIQFLIDSGYDFLKPIPFAEKNPSTFIHSSWQYNLKNKDDKLKVYNLSEVDQHLNVDPYVFCDYLYFFNNLSFEPLKLLTEHLLKTQPNIIKDFPSNGFLILNKALKLRNMTVFKLLLENGFSHQLKMHGISCEDTAKSIGDIYNQYQTIMSEHLKDSLTEEDKLVNYLSSLTWLKKEAKNIGKKQFDSSGVTYLDYLQKQLPLYTQAEQEEMIATCIYSKDFTLLSKVLKLVNKTLANYDPQYYPLWKNLSESGHHQFLYYFLEKLNLPLTTYHQYPDIKNDIKNGIKNNKDIPFNPQDSFFFHVLSFLSSSHVQLVGDKKGPDTRYSNTNKGMKDAKINKILLDKINLDFVLSNNLHDNKNNWFSTCLHHFSQHFVYFYPFFRALDSSSVIQDSTLSDLKENESIDYFRYLLNHTWFAKNNNGLFNIESFFDSTIKQYRLFNDTPKLISFSQLDQSIKDSLLTDEQQFILFITCIKSLKSSNTQENQVPSLMQATFNHLLSNDNTAWNTIDLDLYSDELKRYPEFVSQLRALQLQLKLTSDLPIEKLNSSVRKTKM